MDCPRVENINFWKYIFRDFSVTKKGTSVYGEARWATPIEKCKSHFRQKLPLRDWKLETTITFTFFLHKHGRNIWKWMCLNVCQSLLVLTSVERIMSFKVWSYINHFWQRCIREDRKVEVWLHLIHFHSSYTGPWIRNLAL